MHSPHLGHFLRRESGHLTTSVLFWLPIGALVLVLSTDFAMSFDRHGQMWQSAQNVTSSVSAERATLAERRDRLAAQSPVVRN
jgi:hypothetical protein